MAATGMLLTTDQIELGVRPLELHGARPAVAGLGRDILSFGTNSQVPDELSRHVVSSKKAQANWLKEIEQEGQLRNAHGARFQA